MISPKLKKLLSLLTLFFVCLNISVAQNKNKTFYHLTNANGLSYSAVSDITQDDLGFMWIATSKGLNFYDSNNIKTYLADSSKNSIPHNKINCLLFSTTAKLLIGTENGLCYYDKTLDNFVQIEYKGYSLLTVYNIAELSNNQFLITSSRGNYIISKDFKSINEFSKNRTFKWIDKDKNNKIWAYNPQEIFQLTSDGNVLKSQPIFNNRKEKVEISKAFIDSRGNLWVGTINNGLFRYNRSTGNFTSITIDNRTPINLLKYIREISEDSSGRLWIGTENGAFIYNHAINDYEHFQHSFDSTRNSINDNAVYKIFIDRENFVWFGTYFGGVNYILPEETGFHKITADGGVKSLKGKAVSKIIEDAKNDIWIGTEDNGISIYNPSSKKFNYLTHDPFDKNSLSGNNVHDILQDKNGDMWVGTYIDGLNRISLSNGNIDIFKQSDSVPSISNNSIYSLFLSKNNLLYIGSLNGVDIYDFKTRTFKRFKPKYLSGKHIDEIIEDEQGNIWFCSYFSGIYKYNYLKDTLELYSKKSLNNKGLTSNSFISCLLDSQNRLWFGTRDGGLLKYLYETDEFEAYNTSNSLVDNDIYGILEGNDGNLWLSHNKGISTFNPTNKKVQNFNTSHGLISNQYNFKSYFKSKDGTMYFGALNGINYFKPNEVKRTSTFTKPQFVNFKLFNTIVTPKKGSFLSKSINTTEEIILNHKQNVIAFDFIAPNYNRIVTASYYYYMEGFEKNWNLTTSKFNSKTYTNLNPGLYNFKIKVVSENSETFEKSLRIVILPSPFASNFAKIIYFLIVLILTYLIIWFNKKRQKEKLILKLDNLEKESLKELNNHKINFFTYISHEFKTPLTIILAAIENLLENKTLSIPLKENIQGIEKNSKRLHFLVSQLLEFRKTETDHAPLNNYNINIIGFLKDIIDKFNPLFHKKNITIEFIDNIKHFRFSIDSDKFEKIISNLLSNAYKNANEFGKIVIQTEIQDNKEFQILIKNSGSTITDQEKDLIFKPFHMDNSNQYENSGIGLALVNSLMKLLNGKIEILNDLDDTIVFKLSFYINELNKLETQKTETQKLYTQNLINSVFKEKSEKENLETKNDKEFEILIVEDNSELRALLKNKLNIKFNVKTANNGINALQVISNSQPDLILSDIMMPKMDGFTLCKKLKESTETSHIPIILLTAMTEPENRIDGFYAGADAYISKPFIFSELLLIINNIINSKTRLKEHLKNVNLLSTKNNVTNQDEKFIVNIQNIVLKHIENPNFNIETFTKEAGVSKTTLYVKIKKILNLSTSEFINTIRLNEAIKLLNSTNLTVAEISFKTGFKDPNYFSRIFKKTYNVSPSKYCM